MKVIKKKQEERNQWTKRKELKQKSITKSKKKKRKKERIFRERIAEYKNNSYFVYKRSKPLYLADSNEEAMI